MTAGTPLTAPGGVRFADAADVDRYGAYRVTRDPGDPRPLYRFAGRIGTDAFPAEPGRYHLYSGWFCPWAQRTVIVRALKGLEGVVSLSYVDHVRDARGWAFREETGPDPVEGFTLLREAYEATEPGFDGHRSVPVLWDKQQGRIVSNNFPDITIDLATAFEQWADPSVDTYPVGLRPQIDELNQRIYEFVNNGVYRCGFAPTQAAYDVAVVDLFAVLDELDQRLADRRFLFGDSITESDVRLWVTLARFDAVYVTHFKTNLRRLVDHPNLWPYARDLYQHKAFGGTTDFDHIKRHYFTTHPHLNPGRIVPAGPILDWTAPHGREALHSS